MRAAPLTLLLSAAALWGPILSTDAQAAEVTPFEVDSPALAGNLLGDPSTKTQGVYLPPGYDDPQRRFPVIYVFHGQSSNPNHPGMRTVAKVVDRLIRDAEMSDAIVVLVDGTNRLGGAFFVDSPVTGGFETYVTRDLIAAVDATYRTIPHADSRAVLGNWRGGYNAMHVALSHPDLFGAVSSQSGPYNWGTEASRAYFAGSYPAPETLAELDDLGWVQQMVYAIYPSFLPAPDRPPLFMSVPFQEVNGEVQPTALWDPFLRTDIMHDVGRYAAQELRLRGIQIVHGRNGALTPLYRLEYAEMLSRRLTELGFDHELVEHDDGMEMQPEVGARFLAAHLRTTPTGVPRLAAATAPTVLTRVGQVATVGARVRFDGVLAAGSRLLLDAADLDIADPMALAADGRGGFSGSLQLRPRRAGRYRLPVLLERPAGDRYQLATASIQVFPAGDARVLDESVAPTWTVEVSGGAGEPVFGADVAPVAGARVAAVAVDPASFVGWQLSLTPSQPIPPFGYDAIGLSIHPGDLEGRTLVLTAGGTGKVTLVGTRADTFAVDLTRREWQRIVIPVDRLVSAGGAIEFLRFSGSLEGTFYLDDVRLVASPPPAAATAVQERHEAAVPDEVSLSKNYPNPFNSDTVIDFQLPAPATVDLAVFGATGQRLATLVSGVRPAGRHAVRWDGRDDAGRSLGSGVYFYQLRAAGREQTRKLLLLR